MNAVKEGNLSSLEGRTMYASRDTGIATDASSVRRKELHFDGNKLSVVKGSKTIYSTSATSGQSGYNSSEFQYTPDVGPIPEGTYYVDPSEIQRWKDLPLKQKIAAQFNKGQWPGGTVAWGHTRVPVRTAPSTYLGGRSGNYFIHGGFNPGSRGCIDLTSSNQSFFNYLSGQNEVIPLYVKYPN